MPRFLRASLRPLLAATVCLVATVPMVAQPVERDMYVSVLDQKGAPVTGLGPADFLVREDGVAREVLRVRRATAPMQIAILVDTSRAATPAIRDLRVGLQQFVETMREGNELAIVSVGDAPRILTEYTNEAKALKSGVDRIFAQQDAGSYILDGLVEVSRGLRKREAARPVIVLLMTEGIEYSNSYHELVLEAIRDSGAAFHALAIGQSSPDVLNDEIRSRNIVLDKGTRQSGGRREQLLTSMAVEPTLKELAEELKHQYVVTYARPQSLIPPEKTEVSVKTPGLEARGTSPKSRR